MNKPLQYDRYMYLHDIGSDHISISVKLDDEGVVIDAWQGDKVIGTECKIYRDFGLEVKEFKPSDDGYGEFVQYTDGTWGPHGK